MNDEALAEREAFEFTIHPDQPYPDEYLCPRCGGYGTINETIPETPDYVHYSCPECCGTGDIFGKLRLPSEVQEL